MREMTEMGSSHIFVAQQKGALRPLRAIEYSNRDQSVQTMLSSRELNELLVRLNTPAFERSPISV